MGAREDPLHSVALVCLCLFCFPPSGVAKPSGATIRVVGAAFGGAPMLVLLLFIIIIGGEQRARPLAALARVRAGRRDDVLHREQ